MKVQVILPNLAVGGAERATILLLKHLNRENFNATLLLYKKEGKFLNGVPPDIPIKSIESPLWGVSSKPAKIIKLSREIKSENPDLVWSHMRGCNLDTIIATNLFNDVPTISTAHGNLTSQLFLETNATTRFLVKMLAKSLYPFSDGIIAVSRGVKDDLVKNYGVPEQKIKVIYNPIDLDYISRAKQVEVDHPWFFDDDIPVIISVGRLVPQKGYSYLLKSFKLMGKKVPCRLVIIGQGEERNRLKRLAQNLGIGDSVAFLGLQENPFKYVSRSSVFVLSSLVEGFPIVLLETMVCGVPVVSTRCPSGPDEIIENGINGLLVPVADVNSMADAIMRLLTDEELSKKVVENAKKKVVEFDVKRIVKKYENYFEIVKAKHSKC